MFCYKTHRALNIKLQQNYMYINSVGDSRAMQCPNFKLRDSTTEFSQSQPSIVLRKSTLETSNCNINKQACNTIVEHSIILATT